MIDIATVVFQEELAVLRLQAESIDRYCQNLGIRNIYVICNEDDEVSVQNISSSWWGSLSSRVLVIPRSAFSTEYVENGWVSQQVLKLMAAAMSYSLWTMVLDAKTIITKELSWEWILDTQGRPQVGTLDIYPVFAPSRELTERLFNIKMSQQLGPGGVPFFFHNPTVRAMIAYAEAKSGVLFPPWFQLQGVLTEFMLYSGFVQFRDGDFSKLYAPNSVINPINVCHSEVEQWHKKIDNMKSATTVSVHRNAWNQLSEKQKNDYKYFLVDQGISGAWLIN